MHTLLVSALIGGIVALLSYQWHRGSVAKRAALIAKAVYVARVTTPRPSLFDANITGQQWMQLSRIDRKRVRQSLWLNVMAMEEHKRRYPAWRLAQRLDRAAGLGGPTWHSLSPYSSRQMPA